MKDILKHVYTSSEAEREWGLKEGTVRSSCLRGKMKKYIGNGVKRTDKTWLVLDWVMDEVYGEQKIKCSDEEQ